MTSSNAQQAEPHSQNRQPCPSCGSALDAGGRFCERCGALVAAGPPPFPGPDAEARPTPPPRASAGSPVALLVGGLVVVAAASGGAWWFSVRPVPAAPVVVADAPEPVQSAASGEVASASPAPGAPAPATAAAVSDIVVRTPEQVAQAAEAAPASALPRVTTPSPASQGAPRNQMVPASPSRVSAPAPPAAQDEPLPGQALASSSQRETAGEPTPTAVHERVSSVAPLATPQPTPSEPIAAATVVPAAYSGPRSGTLTYSGRPVIQNGEIVFERLPPLALKLTYDTAIWTARVAPGSNNTQRIILRNTKPGTQKTCVVRWDIVSE